MNTQNNSCNTTSLVYVGDKFYHESSTFLSSLYTEDGARFDWEKVKVELRRGNNVLIRPATPDQIRVVENELINIKADMRAKHEH